MTHTESFKSAFISILYCCRLFESGNNVTEWTTKLCGALNKRKRCLSSSTVIHFEGESVKFGENCKNLKSFICEF